MPEISAFADILDFVFILRRARADEPPLMGRYLLRHATLDGSHLKRTRLRDSELVVFGITRIPGNWANCNWPMPEHDFQQLRSRNRPG
jgi:hypothetical protein